VLAVTLTAPNAHADKKFTSPSAMHRVHCAVDIGERMSMVEILGSRSKSYLVVVIHVNREANIKPSQDAFPL
jgi:hypothetical protein